MVAMAHANDMETYAGGTVAKFVDEGYRVILVMLTANMAGADIHQDGNFMEHAPKEVMAVREKETHEAAQILGVDTILQMGFKDSVYHTGKELAWLGDQNYDVHHPAGAEPIAAAAGNFRCIKRMQTILEKYEPQIVITHNLSSGYEHTCAAQIVNQAFGQAVKDGAKLGSLWIPTQVRHAAWESDVRLFASPSVLIDVTDYWTLKLKALRAHQSQHSKNSIRKLEIIGQYWGIARQCRYAEPFFCVYDAKHR